MTVPDGGTGPVPPMVPSRVTTPVAMTALSVGGPGAANHEDIVVVRSARDQHGDQIGIPTEHTLPGCVVAPLFSTESYQQGERVLARWQVYVLAGADVRATDRLRRPDDPIPESSTALRVRGPWQIVGDPAVWKSAWSSWNPGMVLTIERDTG